MADVRTTFRKRTLIDPITATWAGSRCNCDMSIVGKPDSPQASRSMSESKRIASLTMEIMRRPATVVAGIWRLACKSGLRGRNFRAFFMNLCNASFTKNSPLFVHFYIFQ